MLLYPCGGLALARIQLLPLALPQRDGEQKGRTGLRMLQGWNKDGEITTQLLSWVKQTQLGEFNLIYCRVTYIFNYWVTKKTNIKTLGGIHLSSFPSLSFTPDISLPRLVTTTGYSGSLQWGKCGSGVGVRVSQFFCCSLFLFSFAVVWVLHGPLSLRQCPAPGQSIFPSLPLPPLLSLTLFSRALCWSLLFWCSVPFLECIFIKAPHTWLRGPAVPCGESLVELLEQRPLCQHLNACTNAVITRTSCVS